MNKLQRVQNNLARVVCDVSWRQAHSADLLRDLHWLPVPNRVTFKVATLCYRSCKYVQPAYLPLAPYTPSCNLRSSNSDRLNEPLARLAVGERRFSHYAPRVWNSLPIKKFCQICQHPRYIQGSAEDKTTLWRLVTFALSAPYKYSYLLTYSLTYLFDII